MAASDAKPFPVKGQAYRLYLMVKDSSGNPVTSISSPDSEVSLDGAVHTDVTGSEATHVSNGLHYVDITGPQMNADFVGFLLRGANIPNHEVFLFPMEEDDTDLWFLRMAKRDWTGITGEAARSFLNAGRILRNKFEVDGSNILHVKKENDSDDAWTSQLTTSASAAPIVSSDPA